MVRNRRGWRECFRDLQELLNINPSREQWEHAFLARQNSDQPIPPHILDELWKDSDAAGKKPAPAEDTGTSTGKTRRGLKWMNGAFVFLWGLGIITAIFDTKSSSSNSAITNLLLGFMFAAFLLGYLAARNPAHSTLRRVAKVFSGLVLALAIFTLLRFVSIGGIIHGQTGYVGSRWFYGLILSSFFGIPAFINLRAFWRPQPTIQPQEQASHPSTDQPVAEPAAQTTSSVVCDLEGETEQTPPGSATPIQEPVREQKHTQEAVVAQPPTKQANYFIRHWRGDLSLGVSYWANGMLGTFLILFAANMLVEMRESVSLKWLAVLSLVLYALALLVSVWQAVGVWRSAGKHTSRGGNSGWATAARIAVGFGVLSTVGVFINNYIPQSAEMVRILAGDKTIPAYKITVLPGGAEVEFRGGLRAGSARELEKILAAVPQAKVLHIESIGGRIIEAKMMSKLIRARQMTTYTSERCLSAATLVLMSGKERVVAMGAKIGFHAGNFPGATADQKQEMDNLVRTTMQSAGVTEPFINRVLATPSEQMWYPTFEEMLGARVVTSQSLGDRFATSWGLPDAKLDAAIQNISAYPWFSAIRELEPETYGKMMTNFVTALRAGKSEGEATAAISEAAGGLMEKYFPSASDEALLALRDQWIGILSKYKDKNSRACIAVFTQAKINYSRAFPDWDMTNTLRVVEKVMRSGASRVAIPVDKKAADDDLGLVFKPLADKYGNDLLLLQKQDQWMENSQKVCDMLLAMYQQIATLPDKREANLIRYLVSSKDE